MTASNHGRSAKARLALAVGGVSAVVAVAGVARLAARELGTTAGVALIAAVFAACWLVHRVRPLLHPVSQRPREPQLPAQAGNTPAESRDPELIPVL